ncbi:hypothetical protein I6F18_20035 [Bradyrhizobium sp. NBAIM32]|uniref:hypothetical protein n=1 Tax=Bradyrhizobium sp. NBAIM32 TaxID=2793809 RepID=UPI001CD22357|nr:hypothetical protein [Bradyrhizobium sp. NBAIM32]MCA1542251.1 hypothetical protein [Bradyrhizobium sp. NBAIM32]
MKSVLAKSLPHNHATGARFAIGRKRHWQERLFAADDEDDLELVVDECTDVPDCEYVELPPGGVMWESPAKPVPLKTGDPKDEESEPVEFP